MVIEDDVYGEVYFTDSRPLPLRAYSSKVILCNSFTKSIAPGLRIGWIASMEYANKIQELKQSTSKYTAEYPQCAIAEFLRTGGYDLHMRKLRNTLSKYRNEMRIEILRVFPKGTNVTKPEGGFVLWVELPLTISNLKEKMKYALQKGNYFIPGHFFSLDDEYQNCLRINFGFGLDSHVVHILKMLGEFFRTD